MALKKSELYSSLWASCDELRGGMDASQYKDYVLVLLFIKYVSDKYAGQPFAPITIPEGASFADMVALKGNKDIGDLINKKIIAPLATANKLSDMPDFNDATKLGSGKEMVERLTNLIAIFENKALDFSKNRADGDDILGDAYEYLMRHFATESGKSKGQFYTPAEVSRVMAQILGIRTAKTSASTTVYDPTCGSGSLLLKVGDEAGTAVTLYGQEKDSATSSLARMNMILHNNPTALVVQGNTLTDPKFKDGDALKTFDYVVANPPFSDKRWSTGLNPANDPYDRFAPFGVPPAKQGTTPICCTSSARSRAPAKARASSRTAFCSGATPRPASARSSSARATSRASSACRRTCSTAPVFPPVLLSSTKPGRRTDGRSSSSTPAAGS
jgi:type I restriction enzyme M protein